MRAGLACSVAVTLTAALLTGQPAQASPALGKRPAVRVEKRLVGAPVTRPAVKPIRAAGGPRRVLADSWPAPRTTTVMVPAGSVARAAPHQLSNSPVLLADTSGVQRRAVVQIASRPAAAAAGVDGVLFKVTAAAQGSRDGMVVGLDYTKFADAGGANFSKRLHLVQLPACALISPAVRSCRVQRAIPSVNDARARTLRSTNPIHPNSGLVLAAVAGASSANGSFTSSTLSPSGSWSAGGSSGSFNWSYPVAIAPSATGADVAPAVSLSYNSSSIDGQIATSNNQSSWVGEGWDYTPGYIERTYRTCSDLSNPGDASYTGDLCWAGQIVTMNLGGSTVALVRDDTTGAWHPANDSAQQVTLATGANNKALNGEYWKVTTTSGITYVFGQNVLPGDTTTNATNSTLLEPVYAKNPGDPCYNATFANSECTQAWRWNLDYVIDAHGNATAYHYLKESNYYGADNASTAVGYDRASTLSYIDYGLRQVNGSITAHVATNRVSFAIADRCFASDCSFTTANAASWPDTPPDQQCAAAPAVCNNHAPTFWSTKRLTTITAAYYNGTSYAPVDRYDLAQSFPTTGDIELGLDSISHTGYSTAGVQSASLMVSFSSALLANRVPNTNNQPDMYFWRLTEIDSEMGSSTLISYAQPNGQNCTASTLPTDPAHDLQLCFPVKWTPPYDSGPILDYFQKYLVDKVTVIPHDGRSPTQLTQYNYLGTPAWHADDNEVVKPANQSYGQFRGYSQVETLTGDTGFSYNAVADRQTLTRTTYYRGMGGTVTDSLGGTSPDNNQYADSAHEQQTFNGAGDLEVSATITDLTTTATTATRARTGLPALTATIVNTARSRTITDEAGISSAAIRTSTAALTYDSLGRLVQETDSGSGSGSSDAVATTCTTTTYADPAGGNTRYIRDRVAEKIVSEQSCPTLGTTPSPIRSDVRSYYDTATKAAGVTGVGDPTEVDTRLDSGLTGVTPYFGRTTASYDTAGRAVKSTVFVSATDTTGRSTSTAYTPTLPTVAGTAEPMAGPLTKTVITNAKSQTTTVTLDPARSVPTQVQDVAAHTTYADYDSLGRLSAVWQPGQVHGTDPATTTYSYLVATSGPSSVTTKTLIDNGQSKNYRTSVTLLDSFGQQVQTQADAVGGGSVVTDTYRDSHGWPIDTNNHWLSTAAPGTGLISTPDANVADRTETSYDSAGRPVLANEFNGLNQTWHTQTVYGGNQTTVIPPPGGVAQTTVTDARNETVHLLQYTAAPTVTGSVVTGPNQSTDYLYTALSQQQEIDSAGRKWTTTYDLGGRATKSVDPDTGTTSKTYDDAGELLSSTDANNVMMTYTYDVLGRKTGEYHGTVQTAAHQLYGWVYDTIQAGLLSSSTHYIGTANYTVATGSYDSAGNPLSTVVSLPTAETGFAASYTTSYIWSTTHLPLSTTPATAGGLPAEPISTAYDNLGDPLDTYGVNTIVGYAQYDGYGDPAQYQLGVNLTTSWLTYTVDPQTHRLTELNLSDKTPVPQVEDLSYSYDPSGNLTKSVDVQGNGTSAPTETQCFNYNALDQLTQAWSATDSCAQNPAAAGVGNTVVGGPQPYWQSWTFSAAGLRTQQVQHAASGPATGDLSTNYSYSTPGHADFLTSTTGALASTYTPDAVGNTTARTLTGAALTVGYDLENRTASIAGPAGSSSYVNDANGNQLVRHDPTSTTVYLPGEELSRNKTSGTITGTRYYTFNNTTIAVRNEAVSGNISYLLADPHATNQTAVQTVGTGIGTITRRHFDPYGNQLTTSTGTWPDQHAYLNKPTDPATAATGITAISDIGAREYDPTTGRFLSADPVLDASSPESFTGYDYANNNPITLSDPSGLHTEADGGSIDCTGNFAGCAADAKNSAINTAYTTAVNSGINIPSYNNFVSQANSGSDSGNFGDFLAGIVHGIAKVTDFIQPGCAAGAGICLGQIGSNELNKIAHVNTNSLAYQGGDFAVNAAVLLAAPEIDGVDAAATASELAAESGTGAFSRYAVDAAGNTTIRVRDANETFELTEHAAQRATQRGISIDQIESTVGGNGFHYYNRGAGVYQTGYYDSTAKIFVGTSGGRVTTVIDRVNQNYINNLMNAGPP